MPERPAGQGRQGWDPVRDLAGPAVGAGPAPYPGVVVHVELGGVRLPPPFQDEASRLGIVVHAGRPEQAWAVLGDGEGVVVATVDPYDLRPAVGFVRELRGRGSSVGVVAVAGTRGLRRTTAFPLRRAGADEFLALSAAPEQFAALLRLAVRLTQARRGQGWRPALPGWAQPRGPDGDYRLMRVEELAAALRERLDDPEAEPFALALLRLRGAADPWPVLRRDVRLEEGDLLAGVAERIVAVALEDIAAGAAARVLARLARPRPGFAGAEVLTALELPGDREPLLALLDGWREAVAGGR